MSRYHFQRNLEPILDASQLWKEVNLLSDGAVFARKPVWTLPYLQDLKQHFIDQPDEGDGNFFDKLKRQLDPAKSEVKQLAAEMLWFMHLCPDNITKSRKLRNIRLVWEWSGETFPEDSDWVAGDVLVGAGDTGQGNTHRWYDLKFFIHMMIAFKSIPESARREHLSDGWKFGKWLEQIPECDQRQLRNMIMFLLFPDDFEHIFARTKRRDIVRKFTGKTNAEVRRLSALEIDRELLNIRREKEKEHDTRDLDFYASPLRELWQGSKPKNGPEPDQGGPQPEVDTMQYPLNQILYGPPGTGKTYNTINYAVAIIEDKPLDELEGEGRKEVKQRFDKLKEEGQIAMVTFHQNFTYEDFIEGIRPFLMDDNENTDDNENIEYELSKGVFRKIADRADENRRQSEQTGDESWNMDELLQAFAVSIQEKRDSGKKINLFSSDDRSGATIEKISWSREGNFRSVQLGGSVTSGHTLNADKIKEEYEAFYKGKTTSPEDIKGRTGRRHGLATYYFPLLKKIKQFHDKEWQPEEPVTVEKQNYVLIIDEINRGNIAKIFGELITLIESSKRLGQKDEAKVTLPYSKKEFGVPDNLYIIGTMNTADRSIALLDTALRRRFDFVEMMPDLKHDRISTDIEGVNCQELLDAMNKRIRFLLDREHQIGHTYFLDVKKIKGKNSLEEAFKNKIIPLLQEYFYDNWEKIDLVLNCNGFIDKTSIDSNLFKNSELIDEERKIYELLPDNHRKWQDPKSYQTIYGEKGEGDNDGTE